MPDVHPVSSSDALRRLREGNARFVANLRSVEALVSQSRRASLTAGQSPFAIVLSCSDSRVPSELVFDCGLGDLFVVRVAGNIVAPSLVGSIEFAAASFGTQLVVVMGHTHCGAVSATLDVLAGKGRAATENIHDIVDRISPAVEGVLRPGASREDLMVAATRANIRASVDRILHGSRLLEDRVREGALQVVGAEYSLESGAVEFLAHTLPTR